MGLSERFAQSVRVAGLTVSAGGSIRAGGLDPGGLEGSHRVWRAGFGGLAGADSGRVCWNPSAGLLAGSRVDRAGLNLAGGLE